MVLFEEMAVKLRPTGIEGSCICVRWSGVYHEGCAEKPCWVEVESAV